MSAAVVRGVTRTERTVVLTFPFLTAIDDAGINSLLLISAAALLTK